ncbi:CoF synthetase [Paenibacillus tarimensis]
MIESMSLLQNTIKRMTEHYPWYSDLLKRHAIDMTRDVLLDRLPLITSSVLEEFYYTKDNPFEGRSDLFRYQTSGTSSGRRKTIYYSKEDEEHYLRNKMEIFRSIVNDFSGRTALADMGTGHAAATAIDVFQQLGFQVESVSYQLPVERHLERLQLLKPDLLYTMPSILDRIMLAAGDSSVYGIRKVILVGEIASPAWIRKTADLLRIDPVDIVDTYGSIEIGTIAYYSHEHGRYIISGDLMAEGVTTEELGENNETLADDERVLVLTSTGRSMFPALRYVTYDVVRDLRPVKIDGETRQSFRCLVKRIGTELKHGEKISIYDIENVVYRYLNEATVRVKVTGNALTVYIIGKQIPSPVLKAIKKEITGQIPEIGAMIEGRLLQDINVIGLPFEDSVHRNAVKNKKIYYE